MFGPCVIIPVYDHENAVEGVVQTILSYAIPIVLVDDGSHETCAHLLNTLTHQWPGRVFLVRLHPNQGKGAAVIAGLKYANEQGYTHALQIDADGQHTASDIPRFLEIAKKHPHALIVGHPQYDESVPRVRLFARYLTHVWVWINTLSFSIKDSMCGFRVYPLQESMPLILRGHLGLRMNFDTDILVRLYWEGLDIHNIPTPVNYPEDGVSHFLLWQDNLLITRMHTQLFLGMLKRLPQLVARHFKAPPKE